MNMNKCGVKRKEERKKKINMNTECVEKLNRKM